MAAHRRFRLKDLETLQRELAELGLDLPIDEDLSILFDPLEFGGRRAPNRFLVQPMEGFDSVADGGPGELCFRRYRRYAQGGSGTLWFEATAVQHEARSNPRQLWLHEGNVGTYARLVDETRLAAREAFGHELVMVIQLTHSGRYSKPSGVPRPLIAHHSAVLDPKHGLTPDYPLVDDAYLDRLQDTYVDAAWLAARAGFDGVDIKACHRYLVSELLASFTREGRYGGSLENRSRLLREVAARIAAEVPGPFVTARLNVYDAIAYPYGFGVDRHDHQKPDLTEPLELIGQLRAIGMPLVNVTIGNPYFNPHYGRPYDRPVAGATEPNEHPLEGVARFASITRRVQEAYPDFPIVASGYSWLRHLMPYVGAGMIRTGGAMLVGQGRGAFAYPDSVKDLRETGRMDPRKTCIACSGCTQIMRDGTMTGCVVRDTDIYGPQYKLGRRLASDHLQTQARRCQDCEFPTCTGGCPARVDIPRFIRAFAEGDIPRAYDVLRENNALPEMCAYVCPAAVQCEGGCVERIFAEHCLPIRDIQLVVSRQARYQGRTGVRLPASRSGRRIAVVGGGPAGLACAIRLLERGHDVVLFEKSQRLGGTPQCVIPEARYEDATEEIEAILWPAQQQQRIDLRFNAALGRDISLDDLRAEYGAVFLGAGLGRTSSLGEAAGVHDALTFLREAKQGKAPPVGDRAAVLGGGNTAVDAAMTARRLGAKDVYVVYRRSLAEMPAWAEERQQLLDAGCHLLILTQPLGYETDGQGTLTGVRIARTELGPPDESARRSPQVVPNTESVLRVNCAIEALGQAMSEDLRVALASLTFTRHGLLAVETGTQSTSLPGVYAGGDLVNGGTTAVQGITEGFRAAEAIDRQLASQDNRAAKQAH